jgi:hypothetical protein
VGFRDYWTKPINLKAFLTSMRALFPIEAMPSPATAGPSQD